jgi:hypothetical protein
MRNVLAVLVLGVSIALTGATAFAGDDTHPDHDMWLTRGVVLQPQPTTLADRGTLAGRDQTKPHFGPYHELRLDIMKDGIR